MLKQTKMSYGSLKSTWTSSYHTKTLGTPRAPLKSCYGPKKSLKKVFKSCLRVNAKPSNGQTAKKCDEQLSKRGSYTCTIWNGKAKRKNYDK